MTVKEAYQEILEVCEKHVNLGNNHFQDIKDMCTKAKDHLLIIEWEEKYGIRIDHDSRPYSHRYFRCNDYLSFCYYADAKAEKKSGGGVYISWPDNDKQPKNEWLLRISFSTGAYIFGDDYDAQVQLFQDFFDELKTYKPDFVDTHNKSLYWKLENARDIYGDFAKIINKYRDINKSEFNKRKVEKLKKELEELESKTSL